MLKKHLKNQKGLTLIELLAVIVILGIIAAIAVPSIGSLIDNTKKDAHIANAQQMINAAKLAKAQNAKIGNEDTNYTMTELVSAGFLEEMPKSPGKAGLYDGAASLVDVSAESPSDYTVTLKSVDEKPVVYVPALTASELDRDDVVLN
ncbi:competence type IV pilus major pilin ComGC [Bacillus sinesaloumensis]|uniref:competence type IV pilus major pilin ComGC n=1 Tax=Litchfieldia sinesaloumensis TaxID=1926280 RepID=UPI0009889279|nr:type II secretion system protein [Bacillus sinesaloumensis]